MARIFLTEAEAQEWGLVPKKWWNTPAVKQKVLIRVVSGLVVVAILTALGLAGPSIALLLG